MAITDERLRDGVGGRSHVQRSFAVPCPRSAVEPSIRRRDLDRDAREVGDRRREQWGAPAVRLHEWHYGRASSAVDSPLLDNPNLDGRIVHREGGRARRTLDGGAPTI